jgi:hypothetical protein
MIVQERADGYPGEFLNGQVLGREPAAEVLDGSNLFLHEVGGCPRAMR